MCRKLNADNRRRLFTAYTDNIVCSVSYDGDSVGNMSSIVVFGDYWTPPSFASNAFYVRLLRYVPDAARAALQTHMSAATSEADLINRLNGDSTSASTQLKSVASQISARSVTRTSTLTLADGTQRVVPGDLNVQLLMRYLDNSAGAARAPILALLAQAPDYTQHELINAINKTVNNIGGEPAWQWTTIANQLKVCRLCLLHFVVATVAATKIFERTRNVADSIRQQRAGGFAGQRWHNFALVLANQLAWRHRRHNAAG